MSLLSGAYHHPHPHPHPHPQDAAAFYQPLYGPPHTYLHHLPHQGAVEAWDGSGSCSSSSPNSPPPQQLSVGGGDFGSSLGAAGVMRGGRQRTCANKKERKRTQSINNAFADLRDCIPNVPADTKLSKIKTLRLATSYIAYLMRVLATEDPTTCEPPAFRADLASGRRGHVLQPPSGATVEDLPLGDDCESTAVRRAKGRTGWPQHVWALELKQEQL